MQNRDAPGRETGAGDDVEGMYRPIDITWLMRIASFLKPGAVNKFKRRAPGAARTQETIDGISKATDPIQEDILPKKELKIDSFYGVDFRSQDGIFHSKTIRKSLLKAEKVQMEAAGNRIVNTRLLERFDTSYSKIPTPKTIKDLDIVEE